MHKYLLILLMGLGILAGGTTGFAQESTAPMVAPASEERRLPLVLDGDTLFRIGRLKGYSAEDRVKKITETLEELANDPLVPIDSVHVVETAISSDITAGEHLIMTVTDEEAAGRGKTRTELAKDYAGKIRAALAHSRESRSVPNILKRVLYFLILTALFVGIFLLGNRIQARLAKRMNAWVEQKTLAARAEAIKILEATRVPRFLAVLVKLTMLSVFMVVLYLYLYISLQIFPRSRAMADRLLGYVVEPLQVLTDALVIQTPKLVFLAVLIVMAVYIVRGLRMLFDAIERGTISISGFFPDWAQPTFKILRVLVFVLFAVIAFPYIPGSDSPAFKGISVFIGVLVSLGSSSAIANMVAGISLLYRRAFRVGDRVRIGEIIGDVTNMRLQVTHLETIKNEEITVPNSVILGSSVTNYSALARDKGLILHTSVTIGYDTPWRQVHALLELAAQRTSGILKAPSPFVLQTVLNDFYITYELNAYTDQPNRMAIIYSDLHRNIQDAFNEFEVQIMSPHYWGDRAVSTTYVPREKWYEPPAMKDEESL
jgi:small-conductance mechanosensitive channel